VLGAGIGVVRGVVPLPAAATRMRIDDRNHLALLARRLAPRACVLLDEGDRVAFDADGVANLSTARVVSPDGMVRSPAEAA
jgi:hypothetical protein